MQKLGITGRLNYKHSLSLDCEELEVPCQAVLILSLHNREILGVFIH